MRSETGDPGTFDKPLTRINLRAVRLETYRISRDPGVFEKTPYGVLLRDDISDNVSFEIAALRLSGHRMRKDVGGRMMRAFGMVQHPPRHGTADGHADRQQGDAEEANEAQRRDRLPQDAHEITQKSVAPRLAMSSGFLTP